MRNVSIVFIVVFLCISACDEVERTPLLADEYFPLVTGSYIIYTVDSTRIIQNVETRYTYQLRVSTGAAYTNGEGNTSFVVQREKRADEAAPWTPAGTWTARKNARQAIVTEGTTSYVKLQFPLTIGGTWDGNALNTKGGTERCDDRDCDRYEITEVTPDVIVTQSNDPDEILRKDIRTETYRKDVGLVYKESTVLEYCDSGDCFGTQFVKNGLKYKQEMIESGNL
jgi:hypothetical protein